MTTAGVIKLLEAPDDLTRPFHFELPCYGLCTDHLHVFIADGTGRVTVRHGEGEAMREFTEEGYTGEEFLLWVASVHRYETEKERG